MSIKLISDLVVCHSGTARHGLTSLITVSGVTPYKLTDTDSVLCTVKDRAVLSRHDAAPWQLTLSAWQLTLSAWQLTLSALLCQHNVLTYLLTNNKHINNWLTNTLTLTWPWQCHQSLHQLEDLLNCWRRRGWWDQWVETETWTGRQSQTERECHAGHSQHYIHTHRQTYTQTYRHHRQRSSAAVVRPMQNE